jgi:hypothetical protein
MTKADGSRLSTGSVSGTPAHPAPCYWYAMIEHGPPDGTVVTLTIQVTDANGDGGTGSRSFTFGAF